MVAALLNLHKGTVSSLETGNQIRVTIVIRHDVADNCLFGKFVMQIFFDFGFFFVAENQVNFRHGGEFGRRNLGGAAGYDNTGVGIVFAQFANRLTALAFGFAGYGTGIDDNQIIDIFKFFFQEALFELHIANPFLFAQYK